MYNETYDDYIRSILGYPNNNMYNTNSRENVYMYSAQNTTVSNEIEQYYPEIYKIIYPMVCKSCNNNTSTITKELIENMTDEIYFAIESDNEIDLNITINNEVRNNNSEVQSNNTQSTNNRNITNSKDKNVVIKEENRGENKKDKENREDRRIRNNTLRDLIKILIIRQLLRNRPNRPNFPQRPPRPPFPGGPGPGQGRPPIMPRGSYFNNQMMTGNTDIYENF